MGNSKPDTEGAIDNAFRGILITGVSGFVGSALFEHLIELSNLKVTGVCRNLNLFEHSKNLVDLGDIDTADFTRVLVGKDTVVHLAARAHVMHDEVPDPLTEYRKVNVDGTLNLARQAVAAGVKRFIFISSVKVNGESTTGVEAFSEISLPAPKDPYGISKLEAEKGLLLIARETCMEVVIIRPPLVYGPKVKANFLNLLKLSATYVPLPFGMVNNRRSMVYVGNLVDFIVKCIYHPEAANQIFFVSDGKDMSLSSLVVYIRTALDRSPLMLPVPVVLFELAGAMLGKRDVVDRLVGDLQIDSSKARNLLKWVPPYSVEQGIAATVQDFKNRSK